MSREEAIKAILLDKINLLVEQTGIEVTNQQFNNMVANFNSSSESLSYIQKEIERQFNEKIAFYQHEAHRNEVTESYLAGVNPFTEGQNCYLVSYNEGRKGIKAAKLSLMADAVVGTNNPVKVMIDDNPAKQAYRKDSTQVASYLDDLEIVLSQIAYLLNIDMAVTHRVYDETVKPTGILSEDCCHKPTEKFFNFVELCKIVSQYSENPEIKEWLINFVKKYPLGENHNMSLSATPEAYRLGIEFTLKIIDGLPKINDTTRQELKQKFFDMKVFEIFSNSIDSNLTNYGIVVDSTKVPYEYRFASLFDKAVINLPEVDYNNTLLNNFIVNKRDLFKTLVTYYYPFIKAKAKMIVDNKAVIIPAIDTVAKDFLAYGVWKEYHATITNNASMMEEEMAIERTKENQSLNEKIDDASNNDIATNRSNSLQRGQTVSKAKGHSLSLTNGSAPKILLDESGKVNKRFIVEIGILITLVIYILIHFIAV